MQTNWKIGSLFGIPLFLDPLWFVILGLATLNFGVAYQEWGNVIAWSAGIWHCCYLVQCCYMSWVTAW